MRVAEAGRSEELTVSNRDSRGLIGAATVTLGPK
jgi:hypothetical protein